MSTIDEWEAEAKEMLLDKNEYIPPIRVYPITVYPKILALISLIRKKDEVLQKTIAGFQYAWEDSSDQYYQNKITDVKEALALTEELK